MQKQSGSVIVTALLAVGLILSLAFGAWAFSGRQDYKNNSDKKVTVAVSFAKTQQTATDKAKYDELIKQPYKTFTGSATYGTVSLSYPKTWSAYVDQTNTS